MSTYVYTVLLLFDLFIVILIPIETIFDFNRNLKIQNYKYDKYNIFYLLQSQDILLSIADIINCYLLIVIIGSIFHYSRFDINIKGYRNFRNPIFGMISFLMLINGRFLSFVFLIIQMISIRCGFDSSSECYG